MGEWLALPLVALASLRRVGNGPFDEIFHAIAERLVARGNAILFGVDCQSHHAPLLGPDRVA